MDSAYTGKQISERRKKLGLTQRELAEKLHVTDKAVSKWERGINFPDLGLMENLAKALETTPAALLGLEGADRDEVLRSITQISSEQLEDAQRELKWLGWGCVAASVLLFISDKAIGTSQALAYQILYCLIMAAAIGGLRLLFKYGEIRKWNTVDWLVTYCAVIPAVIVNAAYLFTDHGLHEAAEVVLYMISVCAVQLLFYRVMRPRPMKALPLILSTAFAVWHGLDWDLPIEYALIALCCAVTWFLCRKTDKEKTVMPTGKTVAAAIACLLVLCVVCYSSLVQIYVKAFHWHLEAYAQALLDESTEISSDQYGFWEVSVYPEDNMVEFHTGGSGLVPNSTYEGFYYSADNRHVPFQGADVDMDVNVDSARWTDGTDNHGTSSRLRENWFWFEAHF